MTKIATTIGAGRNEATPHIQGEVLVRNISVIFGMALALSACDTNAPEMESDPNSGNESAAAIAGASPTGSSPEVAASNALAPDEAARREAIERSLKGIWRDTPYEISNINYVNEQVRPVGDTGVNFEAGIRLELKFPSGWNASCIGPNAAYGCQFTDANLMQMKPIATGESRTYTGMLTMGRYNQPGAAWESRARWDQRVE